MKTFIFYTKEGFSQDINNNDVENMQVLGFAKGIDVVSACEDFRKNFNLSEEFCFNEVIAQEVLGDPIYL